MLKIEVQSRRNGVCQDCGGAGVVLPRKYETRIEVGGFCPSCNEGTSKWETILNILAVMEPSFTFAGQTDPSA